MNEMKSNNDKCHLLIINNDNRSIKIGEEQIIGRKSVKLLGMTIDNKLNFNDHVTKICIKPKMTCSQKNCEILRL